VTAKNFTYTLVRVAVSASAIKVRHSNVRYRKVRDSILGRRKRRFSKTFVLWGSSSLLFKGHRSSLLWRRASRMWS